MRAVICTHYGGPEVLKLTEINKPTPNDDQILIKMMATTVNAGDARIRRADPFLVKLAFGFSRPRISVLGNVIAGVVEAVGKNCTQFQVGDEVFGLNDKTMGAYAEYALVPNDAPLALKPHNMTFQEAASLVFGGHTALHYLKQAAIKTGQDVLIYGASGAVGSSAVQIAKYYGATVTAVCSAHNIEMVTNLGADEVIDYTQTPLDQIDKRYDVVYETVDKTKVSEIAKLVKVGGYLLLGAVLIKGMLEGLLISKKLKLRLIIGVAHVTAQDMELIAKIAESGTLKPVIDKTYPLDDIAEAHRYVDQGHKKGNVVVTIQ